jgi:hypothetical protein
MRYVVAALWTLLLVIGIFSVQNRASVDVSFLLWSVSLPKVFLILGTYILGDAFRLGPGRVDQESVLKTAPGLSCGRKAQEKTMRRHGAKKPPESVGWGNEALPKHERL